MKLQGLVIKQPFADFVAVSISAEVLLEVTYSDMYKLTDSEGRGGYQRALNEKKRLKSITDFINSDELHFPNSIIIAANQTSEGAIGEDDERYWRLGERDGDIIELEIPTLKVAAAIIDGQHRLYGFREATRERRKNTDLLVAVYFGLPLSYQAYVFSKINFNQRSVDPSHARDVLAYIAEEQDRERWPPDVLSVVLARRLNLDEASCFRGSIIVSVLHQKSDKSIPLTNFVDGFLKLISKNPAGDTSEMGYLGNRQRGQLEDDGSLLREFYKQCDDGFIYKVVLNYFNAIHKILRPEVGQFFFKAVGVQALFEVLLRILPDLLEKKDVSFDGFFKRLENINNIKAESSEFRQAGGAGKTNIKGVLLYYLGFEKDKMPKGVIDYLEMNEPDYKSSS